MAPDVEWISDAGDRRLAVRRVIAGVDKVARGLAGFARKRLAVAELEHEIVDLNGSPAIVMRYRGEIEQVTVFDVVDNRISRIRNMMNPDKLRHLAVSLDADVADMDVRPLFAARLRP